MLKKSAQILLALFTLSILGTSVIAAELEFTVQISSNPPAQKGGFVDSLDNIEVGNTIDFTRTITSKGVVNNSWKWNWDSSHLNCAAHPDFDSPTFKCTVKKVGHSTVSITMYPEMKDGSKRTSESNVIAVNSVEKAAPTPQSSPTPASNTAEPSLEISNISFHQIHQGEKNVLVINVCNKGKKEYKESDYGTLSFDVFINNKRDGLAFSKNIPAGKCMDFGRSNILSSFYNFETTGPGYQEIKAVIINKIGNQKAKELTKKVYIVKPVDQKPATLSGNDSTSAPAAGYEDEVIVNHEAYTNPFPDTKYNTLEGKAAGELYRRAVIGGYPDGEFKGARNVNRAEAAKFLLLARYGKVADITNNGKFPDVKEGEWYVKYVVTAANKGIINGYPEGVFKPQNNVNTAEFLKMLTLTFELKTDLPHSYSDVQNTDWFKKYAGTAEKYKLFPKRTTKLDPAQKLTREEVAVAIYQYLSNR